MDRTDGSDDAPVPSQPQYVTIAERLDQCHADLERAHERIEDGKSGGTVADASLLVALSSLTEAVTQIAKKLTWVEENFAPWRQRHVAE